jgi:hypothetical protein
MPLVWREIIDEYDGKTVEGSYCFADALVTVTTPNGSKTARLGGLTPEQMAKALLRELAREGKT